MELNIDQIKALADLAHEKNLAEIKVENGDERITIKTPAAFVQNATVLSGAPSSQFALPPISVATAAPSPVAASTPVLLPGSDTTPSANRHIVTAPMVGTFYRSPSPEAASFTDIGQSVAVGQTLCIIEAMKLMNELESEVSGKIVDVLAENGKPVEFGQKLFIIETAA